jgi:hypothetical protein
LSWVTVTGEETPAYEAELAGFRHFLEVFFPNALAQAGASRVPDAHDGAGVGEGAVVRRHDRAAALLAHGPALHGRVGGERHDLGAVDRADADEDAAVVLGRDRAEGTRVEERLEAHTR